MTRKPPRGGRLPAAIFAVFVSLTTGACLPRGDAPAGRQILADKSASLLGLVPANGDGLVRVLFFRPGKDAQNFNLWVVAVDPSGGPASEMMLYTDIDYGLVLGYRPSARYGNFPTDSQGRLYLSKFTSDASGSFGETLVRIDPVTGETVTISQGSFAMPLGTTGRLVSYDGNGHVVLSNPDGSTTTLDASSYDFVGDTVFYVTPDGALMRLGATGAPQQLASGVATFDPFSPQTLLITRAVPDSGTTAPAPPDPLGGPPPPPAQVTATLLDTTTLVETPLPDGPLYQDYPQFSPSGRYLTVNLPSQDPDQYSGGRALVDSVTGTIEALAPVFQQSATWRPGHDELWGSLYDPNQTGQLADSSLAIKKPGQPDTVVPGVLFTTFTDDGTYWFSRGAPYDVQESSDLVGLADDPTAPRYHAVPSGSSLGDRWTLPDGRLLDDATVGLDTFENSYVQIVDPRNGATQLVGELGYLSAVGQTRCLGMYHVSYLRGDLTTSDYATGRSTVLAAEFAMAAVAEPQGTDLYPPGGRIVYQFGARFESPWDGLWMANVP